MDLIHRQSKYRDYLKRLKALDQLDNSTINKDRWQKLQEDINDILEDLRDRSDMSFIRRAYLLLACPLIITLGVNSYLNGLNSSYFFLIALAIYLGVAHFNMKFLIKVNKSISPQEDIIEGYNEFNFIISKIAYVESALKIKNQRLIWLCGFFCFFFPPFLHYSYQLIFDKVAFGNNIISWCIALTLSISVWIYYYYTDIKEYTQLNQYLSMQRDELVSAQYSSHELD